MKIAKDLVFRSPIQEVWEAWTDAERLSKWFAPAAEVEAKLGGKYEFYWDLSNRDRMSTKGCTILQMEEPSLLAFNWKGPDPFAHLMNDPSRLTTVTVRFEQAGPTVKMDFEHTGWGDTEEWNEAVRWHDAAWDQLFAALKTLLER